MLDELSEYIHGQLQAHLKECKRCELAYADGNLPAMCEQGRHWAEGCAATLED